MSKRQWMMLFGLWVMVFLFLGFPSDWNKIIAVVTGFFILVGAYRLKDKSAGSAPSRPVPYIEHRGETPRMGDIGSSNDIINSNIQR
jgi:hypothetical protein